MRNQGRYTMPSRRRKGYTHSRITHLRGAVTHNSPHLSPPSIQHVCTGRHLDGARSVAVREPEGARGSCDGGILGHLLRHDLERANQPSAFPSFAQKITGMTCDSSIAKGTNLAL